ncbi:hypothetical protein PUNSTDRAFT_123550 [Punctularia strigosozonata HHB-11173 SS5]|uniref:uncharacterized protein n=1 Tax=Punctularia strigosozonata (strain HHB-11173) TaxID=741275 RepID=UPI0004417D6C|nr:uncharacterized protein PUNSTDRAFT_123550 [Punctularia strigosozonata HHB-11173 SS5]EIN13594.1 hypothetical protein PUNSTDRAFT_123550 [Punctularia strigosozonata HHB-11173 SS5]
MSQTATLIRSPHTSPPRPSRRPQTAPEASTSRHSPNPSVAQPSTPSHIGLASTSQRPASDHQAYAKSSLSEQRGLNVYSSLPPTPLTASSEEWDSRKIRPLPRLPDAPSPGHSPSHSPLAPSPRPLPATPTIHVSSPPPSATVIPASKLPKRTDSRRHGLQLQVSVPTPADMLPSPVIPVPPSPNTRLRRNVDKVTRYLGEDVPSDLVSGRRPSMPALEEEDDEAQNGVFSSITVHRTVEVADEEPTPEEEERWGKPALDLASPQVGLFVLTGSMDAKRYSRHWYREKNGKRVEKDYREVLAGLRKL